MAEDLFLHIGRDKTATSALQQFFWKNRRRLAQQGIYYIKTGLLGEAHHKLAVSFAAKPARWMPKVGNPSQLKDRFAKEIRRLPGRALVSSELFQHVQPEVLTEYLTPRDTKVVFYARPQEEVIASQYNQTYKAVGTDESLSNFMRRTPVLDYDGFLKPWSEVFGRSNIMVRLYRPRHSRPSIFEDILSALEVEDSAGFWHPPEAMNRSLSMKSLQLLKLIGTREVRDRQRFTKVVGSRLGYVDYIQPQQYLTSDQRQAIRETYRESNRTVARLYLGREELFPQRSQETQEPEALVVEDMADLLVDLWEANLDDKLWKRIYGRVRRFLDR
jgi:hypothetical protein